MRRSRSRSASIELLLASVGAITGVVALILSVQANQLVKKQVTDQVLFLSVARYDDTISLTDGPQPIRTVITCSRTLRLANLGGAGTSVVRYSATATLRGEEIQVSSDRFNSAQVGGTMLNSLWNHKASIHYTELPLPIQPFTTIEVPVQLELQFEGNRDTTNVGGGDPLDVSFFLDFSSGKTIVTPPDWCENVK